MYTNLSSVHLAKCDVTGVGIKDLVTNHPGLKYVDLENCEKISPDALQWAESQGVRVSNRIQLAAGNGSTGSGNGSAVRYG
jgi:F-box/TPR repeat protein Pof3